MNPEIGVTFITSWLNRTKSTESLIVVIAADFGSWPQREDPGGLRPPASIPAKSRVAGKAVWNKKGVNGMWSQRQSYISSQRDEADVIVHMQAACSSSSFRLIVNQALEAISTTDAWGRGTFVFARHQWPPTPQDRKALRTPELDLKDQIQILSSLSSKLPVPLGGPDDGY